MIPKIIHYCWFGPNPIPEKEQHFLNLWKKRLPDYEFRFWSEKTFDVNQFKYTKEANETKNYVFITDLLRAYVLSRYGGFYLDMDIEIIKPLDKFLDHRVVLGVEDKFGGILTALMGSEPNHPYFNEMAEEYINRDFILADGSYNKEVSNIGYRKCLYNYGFKDIDEKQNLDQGIVVYPSDYFSAYSLVTGKVNKTDNTHAIHWHSLLWVGTWTKIIKFFRLKIFVPILGRNNYNKLQKRIKSLFHKK